MAEFGAAATLEVTIPDRELRQARRKIERELGDVTVGVDARGARGARADGGAHRDTLGTGATGVVGSAGRGLVQVKQLEKLDDILEVLEKGLVGGGGGVGGAPGGGGGGGGGGIFGGVGGGILGGALGSIIGGGALLAGGLAAGGLAAGASITAGGLASNTMLRQQGLGNVAGAAAFPFMTGMGSQSVLTSAGLSLAAFGGAQVAPEQMQGLDQALSGPGAFLQAFSQSGSPLGNKLSAILATTDALTGGGGGGGATKIKSTFSEGMRQGAKERHERFSRQQNITINNDVTVKGSTERDVERAMDRAKRQTKEELRRELARKGGGARVR